MSGFLDVLAGDRHLPLLSPASVTDVAPAAARVVDRGLRTLEIALRTPAALDALAAAVGQVDLLVGAGTVTTPEQVDRVADLGAAFVVTPGYDAAVVERCRERGLPVLPGVSTPSEVMAAVAAGLSTVKLFPAGLLGGPAYVRALAGPFPDLRVVPSGGVTPELAPDYLALPSVLAVSGSWLVEA